MRCPLENWESYVVRNAVSLERFGISSYAFTRKDALSAINFLYLQTTPLLGGDVYVIDGDCLTPEYANWSCEQIEGELLREFSLRSLAATKAYIETYPTPQLEHGTIVFDFTI